MSVNCNVDIAFFEGTDIYFGSDTVTDPEQGICCNGSGNDLAKK